MPAPIPAERRAAAVAEYRRRKATPQGATVRAIAAEFGISEASLKRFLWLDERGSIKPKKPRGGQAPKLTAELRDELVRMVLAEPTLRLHEVAARISERAGFSVHEDTARRALRARGIGKRRLVREARDTTPDRSDRTRYTDRHRRVPQDRPHRRAYPSDFTDEEWAIVGPLWERHAKHLPTEHELREVLDAIRYMGATGCPWRFIPHDYPPYATVYAWFERWARDGTQGRVNDELRRMLRRREGREDTPSLLIIDSQSAKSREGGEGRGYDGAKKVSGRKRHIAVDTMGLPWLEVVHSAGVQDRDGIDLVVPDDARDQFPRLEAVMADGGYQGRAEARLKAEPDCPSPSLAVGATPRPASGPPRRGPHPRFQRGSARSRSAGSWNAPSPGSRAEGGSRATSSGPPHTAGHGCSTPPSSRWSLRCGVDPAETPSDSAPRHGRSSQTPRAQAGSSR